MNSLISRLQGDVERLLAEHRSKLPYLGAALFCLLIYVFSRSNEAVVHVYKAEGTSSFKDGRILGSSGDSIYEGKEKLLSKTVRELIAAQTALKESNDRLLVKVEGMEKGTLASPLPSVTPSVDAPEPSQSVNEPNAATDHPLPSKGEIRVGDSSEAMIASTIMESGRSSFARGRPGGPPSGSNIISFPVKEVAVEKSVGVVLPAGSYVKAKLMTGVEAPEGKTYPVLLQLDFAYIVPNKKKLDLSGCFMVAKSQGDLSTERVQMQASKLSCVSKEGRMFEREVNGFIADDKDNAFAVIGSVNSKQDRVAAMAFLSSIVEGVGKALQQAQTTQQTNAMGGSQSVMTGNQAEYLAGGGAANAAGMVTQWYLKQAQNLLPTINVGSGQDVWVVMQDSVKLPNDYFRRNSKGEGSESIYTYFSRVVD